jgi:hypothetical protein
MEKLQNQKMKIIKLQIAQLSEHNLDIVKTGVVFEVLASGKLTVDD